MDNPIQPNDVPGKPQEAEEHVEQEEEKEKDPDDEHEETKSKHKRRSKGDNFERDFTCGCGKRYLSYPALYTHVKTKHAGTTPTGTTAPLCTTGRSRGRPRKVNPRHYCLGQLWQSYKF